MVPHSPRLTFREKHRVQSEAGPALQAGGQLGEVVAVEVEDHLQRLPAALDVVEDVGVCGGRGEAGAQRTAPRRLPEALQLPSPGARVAAPVLPTPEGQPQTSLPSTALQRDTPHPSSQPQGGTLDFHVHSRQSSVLRPPVPSSLEGPPRLPTLQGRPQTASRSEQRLCPAPGHRRQARVPLLCPWPNTDCPAGEPATSSEPHWCSCHPLPGHPGPHLAKASLQQDLLLIHPRGGAWGREGRGRPSEPLRASLADGASPGAQLSPGQAATAASSSWPPQQTPLH